MAFGESCFGDLEALSGTFCVLIVPSKAGNMVSSSPWKLNLGSYRPAAAAAAARDVACPGLRVPSSTEGRDERERTRLNRRYEGADGIGAESTMAAATQRSVCMCERDREIF